MEGLFIVFEGIDGAGTTTQARLLHEALLAQGLPTHLTQEPSDGPVGHVIRDALAGRLVVNGLAGPRAPGWATMALLFAADRVDHLDAEIVPNLADGVLVVCDRYVYSSLVYQTETSGSEAHGAWVAEVNRRARRADLTLLLDVDPRVAAERRQRRRSRTEIFDEADLQVRLAARYRRLSEEPSEDRIVVVDGNRAVDQVHRDCWAAVERLRTHREER
jgi:dTMP kinase